ncbi:MAG: serine/threonine-protein kinase [Xenococcaceae cyanobacterium MO_188.B29]|nr:serine/threonine-protein kinase [Xenococcaceae cyanobacterium MO_188.B29]
MLEKSQIISDRYQLIEKLGRNAGRQTWLATDLNSANKEQVVVKLLAFGGDVQWEDLKLFEREAQILKQLNHPRIPKYKDYFSIDDRTLWFGLVQQYIPGFSLKQLLDRGKRFTEADIENIAQEILEILLYLHGLNPPLLHRDIKPSNLIWGEDGQIYLVDFGAVQDRAATEGATFTVVGTYGYAPMEQFGGRAVPASDLYALGATLIHLLTRTAPADLPNRELTIQFRDLVQPASQAGQLSLDSGLANWLEKMTTPAVEKRFANAQQALDALKAKERINNYIVSNNKSSFRQQKSENIVARPINSKVKLYRYNQFLEIVIPRRGLNKLSQLIYLAPITLGSVLILLLILFLSPLNFWLIIIIMLILSQKINDGNIKAILTSTTLKINKQVFIIVTRFFGLSKDQKGLTEEIQDISVNYSSRNTREERMATEAIIINTKLRHQNRFKRYLFGQGLTEEELIWIANEIRSWLASSD